MSEPCYVVWSGGCDSTKLVDDWSKYTSEKNPLYVISVNHDLIHDKKARTEKKVREKLKKIWKRRHRHIEYIEVTTTVVGAHFGGRRGAHQANLWLANVIPILKKDARVAFGYIDGDSFWHSKHHVDKFIQSILDIGGADDVSIEYPLEDEKKYEIIDYLKEENLYDECWYCENPPKMNVVCGKCTPCVTHLLAIEEKRIRGYNAKIT